MLTRYGFLLLATVPLLALAQTADEQLLSAQMAFQQAKSQQQQADDKLQQAQAAKSLADQQLADAQHKAQQAQDDLNAATAIQKATTQLFQQQTQQLQDAWKRKESGG